MGNGKVPRSSNQGWWTSVVAEAVREKKEAWKEIEKTKERGNQPDARMIHTYGQKKKHQGELLIRRVEIWKQTYIAS